MRLSGSCVTGSVETVARDLSFWYCGKGMTLAKLRGSVRMPSQMLRRYLQSIGSPNSDGIGIMYSMVFWILV